MRCGAGNPAQKGGNAGFLRWPQRRRLAPRRPSLTHTRSVTCRGRLANRSSPQSAVHLATGIYDTVDQDPRTVAGHTVAADARNRREVLLDVTDAACDPPRQPSCCAQLVCRDVRSLTWRHSACIEMMKHGECLRLPGLSPVSSASRTYATSVSCRCRTAT